MSTETLVVCPTMLTIPYVITVHCAQNVSSQESQNDTCQPATSTMCHDDHHSHSQILSYQKPCEKLLMQRELIELWELARKRLAKVETAFNLYAMKIMHIIGQTEYEQYHDRYLNAIQSSCNYCYPNK
ncbi:hypothetical protein V8B97DRAFT_2027072 [Scleroderma yunnanense]